MFGNAELFKDLARNKNMLENILDTKAKKLIATLFSKERRAFHVTDVAERLGISKSRASECLRELENGGLLKSKSVGRSVIYGLSSTKIAKSVIESLMQDEKLINSLETRLIKELAILKPISVVRFGSSLRGLKAESDIDILLICRENAAQNKTHKISAKLSEEFGIPVSITVMGLEGFRAKAKKGEEFVLKLIATHKLLRGKDPEDLVWREK